MPRDIACAVRQLRRQPVFAVVAILTLSLGIGASAAVFSVADAVLLKSLPVEDPRSLVLCEWTFEANPRISYLTGDWSHDAKTNQVRAGVFSAPALARFESEATTLARVFASTDVGERVVVVGGDAERRRVQLVSAGYFSGLGVPASVGRTLGAGDENAAVISHGYWTRRFGGHTDVIGRTGTVDGQAFTIVGVAARRFEGTLALGTAPDLFLPLALQKRFRRDPSNPNAHALQVMGRLKPGVSSSRAEAELGVLLERSLPEAREYQPRLRLIEGHQGYTKGRSKHRDSLVMLGAIAALVLLMACSSVAALQRARASAREGEMAVRRALGAGRLRLMRQLLSENLVLAALSAAGGVLVAFWTKDVLAAGVLREAAPAVPLDLRVLAFTAIVGLASTVLIGLRPALRVSGATGMPHTSRTTAAPPRSLVAIQIAVCFVLLVGAGLLLRTLSKLADVDAGFDRESVVVFRLQARDDGRLAASVRERLRALPSVQAAGSADHDLVEGDRDRRRVTIDGGPAPGKGRDLAFVNHIGGDFFAATGIALRSGRATTEADAGRRVMVVNEAFAREFFPEQDALGRRVNGHEIVGVAADTKYGSLRDAAPPTMFIPWPTPPHDRFFLRTDRPLGAVAADVRGLVRDVSSTAVPYGFETAAGHVSKSIGAERFLARLLLAFGGLAVLLAGVGLYGLLAYVVHRRRRDIGVRMALGAQPADIARLALSDGVSVALAGIGAGALGALALSRVLRSVLYEVSEHDPATFAVAAGVLAVVTLLASWRPARQAAHLDPAVALRYE